MSRGPVVIIGMGMVAALLLLGVERTRRSFGQPAVASVNVKENLAPNFALPSLDGKTIRLSDSRGKAVLLNFWATWCAPCKIEMPWFVELQNRYGSEGLQVVGVAMDDASPTDIGKFVKDLGVNYPILVGKDAVGNAYGGVQFLPSTFYIGRDGKIVDKVFGLKTKNEIENDVKKALAQGQVTQAQK